MLRALIENVEDWFERRQATQITPARARERAGRGARYLDDVDPDWFWHIDPDMLELGNGHACVLGQLYGSFITGLSRVRLINFSSTPRPERSPVALGFLCLRGVCQALQEQDYEYLNQAWQEEIRSRQEVAARDSARRIRSIEPVYIPADASPFTGGGGWRERRQLLNHPY